ncbi:XRE family transcriptional regulator [Saccharopolyspora karakumensis]|uniref:XRE family transcriptional regulator n=2 Tax=Saccharopolyspora karakumensis TaxID=2530386 RepID=A0A4R5BFF9_9PSEU|nr:XRE family transcriptional regulator [Saccharopolyspora karakumensis]
MLQCETSGESAGGRWQACASTVERSAVSRTGGTRLERMAHAGASDVTATAGDSDFVEYLERHLAERGWTVHDFCEHSGLRPSVVFRWRKGYRPDIGNARIMARALGVPLLEVLVKAGRLSADEAGAEVRIVPELDSVPTQVLLREVSARVEKLERSTADHAGTGV